jgi:hypothetical protein
VENETLKVNLDIYGKRKPKIKRNYTIKIKEDIYEILHTIVRETTETLVHYNPDTACLIVNTESPCTLYIDSAVFGRTPRRFILPAGDYNVKVVYEDENFKKIILQKQIALKKGTLYDLGQGFIKILVKLNFNINVEAEVFCNNKRIGTTATDITLPVTNRYIIDLVYTDIHNEKQSIRKIITTESGEDITINHEFKNRIKMISGNFPFSGKLGTGLFTLPHTFGDLEPGIHRVQVLLEDPGWKRNWIILDKRITLNIAETAIIDKSDFIYRKYWGLCFIPGVAQFYNFEPVKGTVILAGTGISIAGSIVFYFLMEKNSNNVVKYNMYKTATYTSLGLFSGFYIYSCFDGFITMIHLYKLFYSE